MAAAAWLPTAIVASPILDATDARITAVPEATAVTTPLGETVATFGDSDDHTKAWPGTDAASVSYGPATA